MAIWNGKMFKGVLGSQVFREMNEKQIVSRRLAKGEMKQTKATKAAGDTFRMASKLGMQLRGSLKTALNKLADPGMSIRMTTSLREILAPCRDPKTRLYSFEEQSFSQLNGFDFNFKSPLSKSLLKNVVWTMENGTLTISLPASNPSDLLLFPAESSACELMVALSLFRLGDGLKKFAAEVQVIKIMKNAANLDQQDFVFEVPDGCLCIASIFLKYYAVLRDLSIVINAKTFSPAGICTALITPNAYQNIDKRAWVRMPNLKFKLKKRTKI